MTQGIADLLSTSLKANITIARIKNIGNYSAYPLIYPNSALEVLIYRRKLRPPALILGKTGIT